MAKIKAIMKYMGNQEAVMWHGTKWTYGKEVEFTDPEDILAVRSFMKRPDIARNWYIRIEEVPMIGSSKVKAEAQPSAPPPPPPPNTAEELEKAKDILDEVINETKPKRNYTKRTYTRKKK